MSLKLLAARTAALAALAASLFGADMAAAATVYDDGHGKAWRQLTNTQNLSWNTIASVCPVDGATACSGMAGGVDMTGWVFANVDQVGQLFSYFGDFAGGLDQTFVPQGTSHAPHFLDTAISPTYQYNINRFAMGWTATPDQGGLYFVAEVQDLFSDNPDLWTTQNNADAGAIFEARGAWMWQPALNAVPEPATWALFILGFGAMGATLRAQRRMGQAL